jgi:hypothetical protein
VSLPFNSPQNGHGLFGLAALLLLFSKTILYAKVIVFQDNDSET